MSEFDLNALVRDALAEWHEPDPSVVARRLLLTIPAERHAEALEVCLRDRVRIVIGQQRMHVRESQRGNSRAGRSRWERHGPVFDALSQPYSVNGEWKPFGELTADDCDVLAADYARRAAEQAAMDDRFRKLARLLRSRDCARVADLHEAVAA